MDLVTFPVLSQIEPQAPLLVVPRVGAGSAQETKILNFQGGHQRSYTGGGSSNCFVDHSAQEWEQVRDLIASVFLQS